LLLSNNTTQAAISARTNAHAFRAFVEVAKALAPAAQQPSASAVSTPHPSNGGAAAADAKEYEMWGVEETAAYLDDNNLGYILFFYAHFLFHAPFPRLIAPIYT
jgi:hypothetical protein